MNTRFDRLMSRADEVLFDAFGEGARYQDCIGTPSLAGITVVISHNVESAGADGVFRVIQHLAEIRLSEVPNPTAQALLTVGCKRYRLDERIRTDGLVEYWSLLPER